MTRLRVRNRYHNGTLVTGNMDENLVFRWSTKIDPYPFGRFVDCAIPSWLSHPLRFHKRISAMYFHPCVGLLHAKILESGCLWASFQKGCLCLFRGTPLG